MRTLALVLASLQAPLPPPPTYPFAVGERFEYAAKFGILTVGQATIEVASIDTLRGQPAFHFRYTLDASAILFRISSTLDSWTSIQDFHSLRFRQDNKQNNQDYLRLFEIFPDSGYYRQVEPGPIETQPTVAEPLDDASVLYFVRTTPLEVGQTYKFTRYFRADRNPIMVTVLKRETLELPDGTKAPCLVLNPVVGERGLFAPRNEARLWVTDDAHRIPVQIRSRYPWGAITLRLEHIGSAH